MALGPRDRRFAGKDKVDVESLEQENDKGLDMLSERVALLKAASHKINNEVVEHNSILDSMGGAFATTRGMLSAVTDKFRMAFTDKGNKWLTYGVAGIAAVLVLLWFFTRR